MDSRELNELCKRIEVAFRGDTGQRNVRLGSVSAQEVFGTMVKHGLGMVCPKCVERKLSGGTYSNAGKYCSSEHSTYYRRIMLQFYGCPQPLSGALSVCPSCFKPIHEFSKDHIIPLAKGGLEFDRENIQWMCLACNIEKSDSTPEDSEKAMTLFYRLLEGNGLTHAGVSRQSESGH
jgi:5-methylcytosine-specific restriction endonuclease McrA